MKLILLATIFLMVTVVWGQDPCSQWRNNPIYKTKADCEESVKVYTRWNDYCTGIRKKAGIWVDTLSSADRSAYSFCLVSDAKDTTNRILDTHKNDQKIQDFWKIWRGDAVSHWEDTRDVFCMFHPSNLYVVEGDHPAAHCSADDHYSGVPDTKTMGKLFREDEVLSSNVVTFSQSVRCDDEPTAEDQRACTERLVDSNKSFVDAMQNQKK